MDQEQPESIFQLVYISAATRAFGDAELAALLRGARTKNSALGVSGMLLYHEGSFIQVLEGPRAAVEGLFARIERDERHCGTRILSRRVVEEPSFEDWSMGFYRSDETTASALEGFSQFLPEGFRGETDEEGDLARRALLAFREGNWRAHVDNGERDERAA